MAVGDNGWLNCEWEEEDDHVYTLKWYLGLHEFYRWTPAEIHEEKVFPLPSAFQIDNSKSSRGRVRVYNVTLMASGTFRCEISGEAPFFRTSFKTANLTVFDLPDDKPTITGLKPLYRLKDYVDVNCTSYNAKPTPELKFYLNHNLADPQWIMEYPPVREANGLWTQTKGLRFKLQPNLPTSEQMLIKCISTFSDLYWESTDKVINIELPSYFSVKSDDYDPNEYQTPIGGISSASISTKFPALLLLPMLIAISLYIR